MENDSDDHGIWEEDTRRRIPTARIVGCIAALFIWFVFPDP